ncbi:MAG: succinyldiaminopimelate transaminase [Immundisolibacteraceae bacterium]|nr:succinyldiaminopimelate transaminase [Immundisolibacteraceae bacterium]
MNPGLDKLHPYPFEKLSGLLAGLPAQARFDLSIGEPKHPTPEFITKSLLGNLNGLASYPKIIGDADLRDAIADWLQQRFTLAAGINAKTQVLPVNGTREALFAIAQCLVDPGSQSLVLMPNPGYQIYEGAALLSGAEPIYLPLLPELGFNPDYSAVSDQTWQRARLLYLCSPGNPCGGVIPAKTLQQLIELSNRHNFVIAADECYSEIYSDEDQPPVGLLEAAVQMGQSDFRNCLVFHSLSKRSNVPGMRSGFVAGDEALISTFRRYRTYHGCAMAPPFQAASAAAWRDEHHVKLNRRLYREKFDSALTILQDYPVSQPDGGFYLWIPTPIDDQEFAKSLYHQQGVKVIPGSFLGREQYGLNPAGGYIRCALVAEKSDCDQAIKLIAELL